MSIDKKGFRYRLSNVIAWSALGGVAVGIIIGDGFGEFMTDGNGLALAIPLLFFAVFFFALSVG